MFYWANSGSSGCGSEPLDSVGNMSKSDILRGIITEKLSTAAREILAVVERTVADYEEEAVGFKREIDRQRRQLELLQPRVKLERRDLDIHELMVMTKDKEEEEQQQHTYPPELTPDLHSREVVMEARQEDEQHTQQPDVEDIEAPGLLLYSENHFEEEAVEMPSVQPETSSTLKEPDHQIPARLFSPKVQSDGGKPRSTSDTHLDFRIRILEDCPGNVLSNTVFQNSPVQHLKCPRDLPEADFLGLLRSTFPQLANEEHVHFFKSSKNRLLQHLEVKSLTPEEIYQAIRSAGNSALYIRLKMTTPALQQWLMKPKIAQVFEKYPLGHLRCPRGLQEDDFLELLRSTFPQLATDEPLDFFMSSTNRKLRPLKVDPRTPEEIYKAIKSCGHSALYIKPKKKDVDSSSATTSADQTENSTRRESSNPLISDTQTPLDFRICILEDSAIDVLSNIVFKKYPLQDLRCPRGLQEDDFLDLLRSTFPQLANDESLDFFISSRNRKLRPLKVDPRTPEEIYKAIGSCGHSALYITPKAAKKEEKDLQCLQTNVDPPSSDAEAKRSEKAGLQTSSPTEQVDGSTVEVLPSCSTSENQQTEKDAADSEMDTSDDMNGNEVSDGDGDWEPDPTPQLPKTTKKDVVELCVKRHDADSEMDTGDDMNGDEVSDGGGDWEPDPTPQLPKTKTKQVVKDCVKRLKSVTPCKVCGIGYTFFGSLIKHSWSHVDEQNVCGVCGKTFDSVEELKEHIQNYQKTYDCSVCGKSFYSKDGLRSHTLRHTGNLPYKCSVCGKTFDRMSVLRSHRWVHVEEKPFRCDICPKSFAFKAQLTAHTMAHICKEQYHCNICGKSVSDRKSLSRHRLTHTEEQRYCCHVCGKCFKLHSTLKLHEQIHTVREQSYLCDICCKTFMSNSTLKAHMRTHSTERPFICVTCNKGFVAKAELKKHIRVHTGEAPYGCNICGRFFKQRAALNSHVRGHSGIKQYVCEICGKAASRKSHLKIHMRTHNGERPYKCTLCDKAFTQSHCLKSHMETHEPEEENPIPSQMV
ncbi:uncharacterized protein LOC115796606 [Archocentrus centrarchus]|uniref:uncharacterized protein LOC115796606 n=1 Tax=Archocentrus centrarchus TaxID=63155 RepID=UPI0011E9DC19|nr:uncharacterized protein LOC115796606 [Archocentrus centrarchus]